MAITFQDKTSAIEFVKQKLSEGEWYELFELKKGGYTARLSSLPIKGLGGLHYYNDEKDEDVIMFPPKANTRDKLHEVAHKELKHRPQENSFTAYELLEREYDAESLAYKYQGKEISAEAISNVNTQLIEEGYTAHEIMEAFNKLMEKHNYKLTSEQKNIYWERLQNAERSRYGK